MDRFTVDTDISPEDELISLLEFSGIQYLREDTGIRFLLADGNNKWETLCQFTKKAVIIYGIFPFESSGSEKTLSRLNEINRQLTMGGMFLLDGTIVMRTCADLFDAFSASETIARALEYNAGAICKFWRIAQPW